MENVPSKRRVCHPSYVCKSQNSARRRVRQVKEADEDAHRFAGELLLPEEIVRAEVVHPITLSSLLPYRAKRKVSVQFLIRRLVDLEIISQNQYRYLMMQVSSRGWRTHEPGDETRPILEVIQSYPRSF